VADDGTGQKKFFKVKYVFGALSYGAKIKSDACIKNHLDVCMLHSPGAFYGLMWLFFILPSHSYFSLKNFPGMLHFIGITED